jgi:hypothetical protein
MFTNILDDHAPFRTRRIKVSSAPWISDEVLSAMQSRDEAHEAALRFKTRDLWNSYKYARNHVTNLIRQTKSEYYLAIIEQNMSNSKTLWKTLKEILPSKLSAVTNSVIVDGQTITDCKAIATAFNTFFLNIGESLASAFMNNEPFFMDSQVPPNVEFKIPDILPNFVENQLTSLSKAKAMGLDGIGPMPLREAGSEISHSLTHIMNKSLSSGIFIDEWKRAKVVPIYKVGDTSDVNNYRPVSILPILSKIINVIFTTPFLPIYKATIFFIHTSLVLGLDTPVKLH